jgi:hypothetical protein
VLRGRSIVYSVGGQIRHIDTVQDTNQVLEEDGVGPLSAVQSGVRLVYSYRSGNSPAVGCLGVGCDLLRIVPTCVNSARSFGLVRERQKLTELWYFEACSDRIAFQSEAEAPHEIELPDVQQVAGFWDGADRIGFLAVVSDGEGQGPVLVLGEEGEPRARVEGEAYASDPTAARVGNRVTAAWSSQLDGGDVVRVLECDDAGPCACRTIDDARRPSVVAGPPGTFLAYEKIGSGIQFGLVDSLL